MSIRCAPSYQTFPVDSLGSAKQEWVTAVHPLILYPPFTVFSTLSISPSLSLCSRWLKWRLTLQRPARRPLHLPPPPPPPRPPLPSILPASLPTPPAWIWRIVGTAPWPGVAAPKTPSSTPPPWMQMSAVCLPRSPTAPARRSRPSIMSRGCTMAAVSLT